MPIPTSRPPAPLATQELDYHLPGELIATRPAVPRDAARLLVVRRSDTTFEHARVRDLPRFLVSGDLLVFNTTAVIAARLIGRRVPSGGRVEGVFIEEVAPGRWIAMLTAGGRLRPGDFVDFLDQHGDRATGGRLIDRTDDGWIIALDEAVRASEVLARIGRTPLPPYIRKARGGQVIEDRLDRGWYETVYADPDERRSVAAPTAGLHFTPGLLGTLDAAGVHRHTVTLHVGPGTFKPVTAPTLSGHHMHAERFSVGLETSEALAGSRSGRVLAVGTTVVRTLESLPGTPPDGVFHGTTDLLIAPPYRFGNVDGMLTNFHLPRSTLLALVAAMVGLARLKDIYAEAIRERYRFYSYGDAMLILP